jgi:hypothetical protein
MQGFIQFIGPDGGIITIEADIDEVTPPPGVVKVGIQDKVRDTIAVAGQSFEDAMKRILSSNARIVSEVALALENPPDELEVTFGLGVTGEVGNFAVTKVGGAANYAVRLTWRNLRKPSGS